MAAVIAECQAVCVFERQAQQVRGRENSFGKDSFSSVIHIKLYFKKTPTFYVLMQAAWIKRRVVNSW